LDDKVPDLAKLTVRSLNSTGGSNQGALMAVRSFYIHFLLHKNHLVAGDLGSSICCL